MHWLRSWPYSGLNKTSGRRITFLRPLVLLLDLRQTEKGRPFTARPFSFPSLQANFLPLTPVPPGAGCAAVGVFICNCLTVFGELFENAVDFRQKRVLFIRNRWSTCPHWAWPPGQVLEAAAGKAALLFQGGAFDVRVGHYMGKLGGKGDNPVVFLGSGQHDPGKPDFLGQGFYRVDTGAGVSAEGVMIKLARSKRLSSE